MLLYAHLNQEIKESKFIKAFIHKKAVEIIKPRDKEMMEIIPL